MIENTKINKLQLYILTVVTGTGSSMLYGIGTHANQDAWIVVLISMLGGMSLILLYCWLLKLFPDATLFHMFENVFNKYLAKIISFLYVLYFAIIASHVIGDITTLTSLYILSETPPIIIEIIITLIAMYGVFLGIETFARFGILVFIFIVPLIFFFFIGPILSNRANFEQLLPILENGWRPIFKESFPLIFTNPFGEIIVFLMIIPYVTNNQKVLPVGLLSMLSIGILFLTITVTNIVTIGPKFIEISLYPTIQAIRGINILNFIQRVEGLAVFLFLILNYMKIMIFLFAAATGANIVFKTNNYRKYIIPISIVVFILSHLSIQDVVLHLYIDTHIVPYAIGLPFELGFVILALGVYYIKELLKIDKKPKAVK